MQKVIGKVTIIDYKNKPGMEPWKYGVETRNMKGELNGISNHETLDKAKEILNAMLDMGYKL